MENKAGIFHWGYNTRGHCNPFIRGLVIPMWSGESHFIIVRISSTMMRSRNFDHSNSHAQNIFLPHLKPSVQCTLNGDAFCGLFSICCYCHYQSIELISLVFQFFYQTFYGFPAELFISSLQEAIHSFRDTKST